MHKSCLVPCSMWSERVSTTVLQRLSKAKKESDDEIKFKTLQVIKIQWGNVPLFFISLASISAPAYLGLQVQVHVIINGSS